MIEVEEFPENIKSYLLNYAQERNLDAITVNIGDKRLKISLSMLPDEIKYKILRSDPKFYQSSWLVSKKSHYYASKDSTSKEGEYPISLGEIQRCRTRNLIQYYRPTYASFDCVGREYRLSSDCRNSTCRFYFLQTRNSCILGFGVPVLDILTTYQIRSNRISIMKSHPHYAKKKLIQDFNDKFSDVRLTNRTFNDLCEIYIVLMFFSCFVFECERHPLPKHDVDSCDKWAMEADIKKFRKHLINHIIELTGAKLIEGNKLEFSDP